MKTSNIEPSGQRAAAATRGSRSTNLAGAKGMVWRDPVTESVGQIRDMTVIGATLTDNEDGTGVLTIGAGGLLIPEATATTTKDTGNPTFNFASLPENIVKVSSTYYCPYINTPVAADIRLATASDRDGPWTAYDGTPLISLTSIGWATGAAGMYAPEIVLFESVFYLFYSVIMAAGTTDARQAIGVATCATIDGNYVDFGAAIVSPGAASSPTSRRVGEPSVIYHGGVWNMGVMGEDSDLPYQESEKIFTYTAPAPTGPWTITNSGNPVIDHGAASSGYSALVADPCLFYANGYLWIMFMGSDTSTPTVNSSQFLAYATAIEGPWTVLTDPILEPGAGGTWDDAWVLRGGLLYEGGHWSGVYTGYDGANWKGGNFRLTLDSGAVSAPPTASDIPIVDAAGYYASTEVEGALQEIGADLASIVSDSGAVGELLLSDAAAVPPIFADILTNEAETDLLYGDLL